MAGESSPIAVTGLGIVSAIGNGWREFWLQLCSGASALQLEERGAISGYFPLGRVGDFEPKKYIDSSVLRRMDRLSRMIGVAAKMASEDAALAAAVSEDQIGIVIGSALGNLAGTVEYLDRVFEKGPGLASPMMFPNLVLNAPASYAAINLGVTGANLSVTQGEVSGEQAILSACEMIAKGHASAVLAGAGDELADITIGAFQSLHAFSGQFKPWRGVRPYDGERDGIGLGEGAGVLTVEDGKIARQRKARVYAEIDYWNTFTIPAPQYDWPRSVEDAVRKLKSNLPASLLEDVDMIMGSGNGSQSLDQFEMNLLSKLFEGFDKERYLTSIKGALGEFGSTGALAAVASVASLVEDCVPPLPSLSSAMQSKYFRLVTPKTAKTKVNRVLQVSVSRGGVIGVLSMCKAQSEGVS